MIFASMFSVYSYFSEYMTQRFNLTGATISILLVMFGASGVLGNWYAGKLLSARLKRTVLFYPIVLGLSYLLLQVTHPSILLIGVIIILWGAAHTSGLIVSQVWLTSESPEAPEFSNTLYVSFSNMGVTLGTAFGGWILAGPGIYDIVFGGILFAFLAFLCIFVRIQYL
ncbi:hypothetical protein SAMN05216191_10344 [Paenibacillus jilunlii]|uniref:Major Facilitator Superfamily protein n=1 Tax=Paenibacillus jilunlii TaxID=682956 RepID=A0A1G9K0A2_9BACL|nr:hypothetical protein SAMN05216191_10344 [Paenibacillus jilunlii]